MSYFLHLPSELLARTFSRVNQSSLKSLRQTCRFTSQLSTDRLYRTLHLRPDETSQNKIREILNTPNLREIPRKIYFDTLEDGFNYDCEKEEPTEQSWPKGWNELVPQMKDFTRLNTAVLCFHREFSSQNPDCLHYYDDLFQTPGFRFKAMSSFFSLLGSLQSPIQDLGIRNLQVEMPKDQETLKNMKKALSSLQSLRLSIVSETNSAAPEHDLEYPEIRQFFKELPTMWLGPTASSLQHLSLYSCEYFGFYPHLDLSNLYFPHLKTLSLGNFCFFHDDQIDWILKHGDTLEEIYLDDCTIFYDFSMMDENVAECGLPRNALAHRPGGHTSLYGSYARRWHDIFDVFAEKLPKLRHFRIGSTEWHEGVPFEEESDIKVGLYRNRYMCCHDGYGPSPHMKVSYVEDDEDEPWRAMSNCDDEDRAALRRLLRKLGQSVDENYPALRGPIENLVQKEPAAI